MAHDTYTIPEMFGESPLGDVLRIADSIQYSPEKMPEAYAHIKATESRILGFRDTALALKAPQSSFMKALKPFIQAPKSPYETLLDKEADVAGEKLLAKRPGIVSQRFFYHDGGDWYYESIDDRKNRLVIHFETTSMSLHKSINGIDVPFAEGEEAHFASLPALYEEIILEIDEYQIDATIHDALLDEAKDNYRLTA